MRFDRPHTRAFFSSTLPHTRTPGHRVSSDAALCERLAGLPKTETSGV